MTPAGHSRWKVQERDARIANGFQRPGRVPFEAGAATITMAPPPSSPPGWNPVLVAEAYDVGRRSRR